jgi:hypothetical protein
VHLQVHKFVSMQVCKFTKLKNLKKFKLIVTIYNFTNCKCAFASSQVCNSTSLQVYKITKSRNYKIIVTNLQLNKLQVCMCKFVKVCKFTNSQNLEIAN